MLTHCLIRQRPTNAAGIRGQWHHANRDKMLARAAARRAAKRMTTTVKPPRKPGAGGKRPGAGRPSAAAYVARLAARLAGRTFVDPGMA